MPAMIRWTWDSSAPDAQGCGVSDGEVEAMAAATASMREHRATAARAEPVRLDVVELAYIPAGRPIVAARDGDSVTWRPAAL
jgi:hypothetical protein